MNKTPIEWCRTYAEDGLFEEGCSVNPVRFRPRGADGQLLAQTTTMCQKVSPGCAHCYAEGITRRFWPKAAGPFPGYTALGVMAGEFVLDEAMLLGVLRYKKPTKIFWGDMTDLFQESVPDAFLDRCFAVCALTPHITHMFLTKRPERMRKYLTELRGEGWTSGFVAEAFGRPARFFPRAFKFLPLNNEARMPWPLPNVWLGVSAENQGQAEKRIPELLNTPAARRFISAEPLLGPVEIDQCFIEPDLQCSGFVKSERYEAGYCGNCAGHESDPVHHSRAGLIDWVIVGGESGPGARPMHPDWARGLRDQCVAAGVPFFFKQWGEWAPIQYFDQHDKPMLKISLPNEANFKPSHREIVFTLPGTEPAKTSVNMKRVGKKAAGALLDGREWRQFPESDLRVATVAEEESR